MTRPIAASRATLAGILVLAAASVAPAQTTALGVPLWRPWRPVLTLGGGWLGPEALGKVAAETRAVAAGTTTPPAATLFRTESTLGGAPRFEYGVAVPLTPRLAVEIGGTLARPTLTTDVQGDLESAPATSATEQVDEYTVGGRATFELTRWEWARRFRPFVAAGGAYLRQLHEDAVLVETGQTWSAGGGVRWWAGRGAARRRPLGVAVETGWSWRTGGIAFADGARSMPWVSLRAFAGF
jgi:hypothetical protein